MICPKCGFEQPDSPECMRCGVIVSRYKGPVLAAASRPASPAPGAISPASPPAPVNQTVRISFPPPAAPVDAGTSLYGGPAPAMAAAAGGTLYDGPLPAAGGGGTVYGDPVPPALRSKVRPAFRGTFESGKVLSEAFSIYFSNFLPFVLLTSVALSPLFVTMAMVTGSAGGTDMGLVILSLLLLLLSAVFCPQLATASITYGVFQQMRGRDATIGDCLGKGLSALFPILGLVIVQGLGILLGLIAFIIPGILLAVRWAVSVPAAVEERPGVFGAMARSAYLTDGFRWPVFGALFVLNFMSQGLDRILNLALAAKPSVLIVASGTVTVLSVGLTATATAVMYYRLRSVKESIDVDQIASVFA